MIIGTISGLFGQNVDSMSSGTFTDKRDEQLYKWVKIGSQTWMAENLKFKADSGAVCPDNNLVNCDYYGVLYSWDVAQIICPEGWSLPSDEQWGILERKLGMEAIRISMASVFFPQVIGIFIDSASLVPQHFFGHRQNQKELSWIKEHGIDLFPLNTTTFIVTIGIITPLCPYDV
jgi:hypothetical protein